MKLEKYVDLPSHTSGGFDHADVHESSGYVFLAHTGNGTVEVIDGDRGIYSGTLPGCPGASGVVCAQKEGLVFAAARGGGKVLVIDAKTQTVLREISAGFKPNGIGWDTTHRLLLTADVEDLQARILIPETGEITGNIKLPGRPRWCKYSQRTNSFWINIQKPAELLSLEPQTAQIHKVFPVSVDGPHGLDIDENEGRAYVACDGKAIVVLGLHTGTELDVVQIPGEPDVVWFNRSRRRLYCAIGRPGVVDVIDANTMRLDQEIETEEGAHTLTFDETRQKLYVFLPRSCRVAVYREL